jgi:outer membrane protein assembly factor BamB
VTHTLRNLLLASIALGLSACGLFGDDDEELEPAELIEFETKVPIKKHWSSKVGGDAEFLRVALRPVGDGNRIYAASFNGNVIAFDPESGKQVWRNKLDLPLASGPGVGDGLVVVVTTDGLALALDTADGSERWRAYVGGESLATPLVSDEHVVVQTVDNRLLALSSFDGTERWSIEQSIPLLTMRGSASPVQAGRNIIAGFDNGRLLAVDISTGDVQWESMLSPPSGRSDLDRLADIDGDIAVVGQDIYAAGYHGRVALENGEIVALNRSTGTEIWRQGALLRREPTAPVSFRNTVVVGDLEGYLHFFSNVDGEPVARVRAGKQAIISTPIVVADRLFVQSDDGTISAWVVKEPKQDKRRAPDTAEEDA